MVLNQKAGNIAGCITICAEVNPKAATKRYEQGWVDVLVDNMDDLVVRTKSGLRKNNEVIFYCLHWKYC